MLGRACTACKRRRNTLQSHDILERDGNTVDWSSAFASQILLLGLPGTLYSEFGCYSNECIQPRIECFYSLQTELCYFYWRRHATAVVADQSFERVKGDLVVQVQSSMRWR